MDDQERIAELQQRIAVLETQLQERQDHITHVVDDIKRATEDGDDTVFELVRDQNGRLRKIEADLRNHLNEHDRHEFVQEGRAQAYKLVYQVGQHWWKAAIGVVAALEGLTKAGYL